MRAADLAIPHPTDDRTKFRFAVGGKNPAVLALFSGGRNQSAHGVDRELE